jgi:two-component system NtrC family sensor kinase
MCDARLAVERDMRTARRSAIRLLQWMMVASAVLPASIFAYAAWLNSRATHAVADERIERTLDVLQEHGLKVFETIERTLGEVDELLRGMTDQRIIAEEQRLNRRLQELAKALPQVKSISIFDRAGRILVTSLQVPADRTADFSDRDYVRAQIARDAGTFVGAVLDPRPPFTGATFFPVSRRRSSRDGAFAGVIEVSVLPSYFEEFYARTGRVPGSYAALIRRDSAVLARHPPADPARRFDRSPMLAEAIARDPDGGLMTFVSDFDSIERRAGYRRLAGYPVYALAGTETAVIRSEWLWTMASHLVFGLPATVLLLIIIGVALERTRRLYAEAERREAAEAALRQSQRLEAIGQLTGGVAHDFNNLLMVVSGSVERLRRDLSEERFVRLLDRITAATKRGEALTRQLLSFSRRQTLTPTVVDLAQLLPELKDVLRRSLRGNIEIVVDAPPTVCAAKVDAGELELAILNLAVNARDAMPDGGTLTLSVNTVRLEGDPAVDGLKGEFATIALSDTGSGIAPEVLPRIFEPFFTTKDFGKGTGLGLSQVYGFARQSGGTITVASQVGRGSAFTLYLPRSFDPVAVPAPRGEGESAEGGAGTVLVVEDNPEVGEVAAAYLERLGYRVRSASNGQAALDILASTPGIDIVFSDILMPGGMSGIDLARLTRHHHPDVPVLLATGYSDGAQDAAGQGFRVLQKPYDIAALKQALSEVTRTRSADPVSDAPRLVP